MDGVRVTLVARTAEGTPAIDPQVMISVSETVPFQRQLGTETVTNFTNSAVFDMAAPGGGGIEWMVTPWFSRFAAPGGQMFFPNAEPQKKFELPLTRIPSEWEVRFTKYAELSSPRFDAFKSVVGKSDSVDLKADGVPPVGNLQEQYDALDLGPQLLAKTALLNLYAVLTDEIDPIGNTPWFSYVQKIVRIDQERFLAEVDKALFDHVDEIVNGLDGAFAGGEYSTEPEADHKLHIPNIPPQYNCPVDNPVNLDRMITVKKKYEQGDVQLTVSKLKTGEYLLDCDMDEHLEIVGHTVDIVIHAEQEAQNPTDTGTHPYLMHEYIVRDSAQANGGVANIDLGYVLV